MFKKIYLGLIIVTLFSVSSAFAVDESLTITTYYPSPYGSYNELGVASRLNIGTTANDAVIEFRNERDLFIRSRVDATNTNERLYIDGTTGNVGIGTTTANARLSVAGTIKSSTRSNFISVDKSHLQLHHPGCLATIINFTGNDFISCNCACSRHCQNWTPVGGELSTSLGYSGGTLVEWSGVDSTAGCACIP